MDENEKAFDDLENLFADYAKKADNLIDVLQTGADTFVKDLKALPSPRSKISKAGYTHMIDTFGSEARSAEVRVGWGKYYGPILEHGSVKMRAREHFKPLWERKKEKYYNQMIKKFHGG